MRYTILSLLLVLAMSSCSEPPASFKEAIRPIDWIQVKATEVNQVRRLSGSIQPVESTNLSFQIGGKVEWVKVHLGDVVKRGDALAQLDQRSYKLGQQSSMASLQQAQSKFNESQNEFQRYEELIKKSQVSQSGYDNAKAAFESAESAVNLAKTQLDVSNKDLQDTLLVAPYNARITKRLIEPSMQVSSAQTVFEVEGEDGFEVQVMVPETMIRKLSKGMELSIQYPALLEKKATGVITEIGSRAESANAFPVSVLINPPLTDLRAGMTAEVDFTFKTIGRTGFKGATINIPLSSLGAADGLSGDYVYVYDPKHQTVSKRIVQTENIIGNTVMISSGLAVDEIIATAGITFLHDGKKVKLLDKQLLQFN